MIQPIKILCCCILLIFTASCGIVSGGSTNSEGSESIAIDASITSFDAAKVEEVFKSLPVKNTTEGKLTLYKVIFNNNNCNSFSYYGISDVNGNVLSNAAEVINFIFKAKDRINVIIRYKSEACSVVNYDTTVVMYFKDTVGNTFSSSTLLHVSGESPSGSGNGPVSCDNPVDADNLLEDRRFGIPSEGKHYLRVDLMRAFIFPPGSPNDKKIIGTDVGGVDPNEFQSPYLEINVTDKTISSAKFTIKQITTCDNFSIPTAVTDTFFFGSPTVLTSSKAYNGEFKLKDEGTGFKEVNLNLTGFRVTLRAEHIGDATPENDKSIIADSATKTFQVGLTTNLTTTTTLPDSILGDEFAGATNHADAQGNEALNLSPVANGKRAQIGAPLSDSHLLLVGKGLFDNLEEDFIGESSTAKAFLIDQAAYLFIQIEATLMCDINEVGCE
ncbi:MAG: hypothetical protein ACD_73C00011G0002 [uncultured bacterium]|nr:MAG: hypothetical protein ACD_73C00011G0002 [uncultured bacterium]